MVMGKRFTDEEFVRAFFPERSVAEAARKLGVTPLAAGNRLRKLRKLGVKFPVTSRRKVVNVSGLNELIEELG